MKWDTNGDFRRICPPIVLNSFYHAKEFAAHFISQVGDDIEDVVDCDLYLLFMEYWACECSTHDSSFRAGSNAPLKGHWTTSASSAAFSKKKRDFHSIGSVYRYLCSDSMLNLTCSFNFSTKIFDFILLHPFLKVNF